MSQAIVNKINDLIKDMDSRGREDFSLESRNLKKITHLLTNHEMINILHKIESEDYIKTFDYENLCTLQTKITTLSEEIDKAKEEIDLDEFYKRGCILNFDKLRKKYKDNKLSKRYPKFNIDRYEELFNNPVLELENEKGQKIKYSKFLVKKIFLAINQMIFDEMDLYIANVGKRGLESLVFVHRCFYITIGCSKK